ncbi:MAG: hypothetical protein IT249_05825 [Chitinophagaceae bacterium]|nr:hypothetical protein [Chitinophagaceae bacterium]
MGKLVDKEATKNKLLMTEVFKFFSYIFLLTLCFNGIIGWATYDKKTVTPNGKTEFSHEFRGMEKINGEWKIISAPVHAFIPK